MPTRFLASVLIACLAWSACVRQTDPVPTTTTSTTTTTTTTTTTAPETTTTTEAPRVPTGGEVVVGVLGEPTTLNPLLENGSGFLTGLIGRTLWTGAQEVDPGSLRLIPDVVAEIPRVENGGVVVNDDGTITVRYEIREEAAWEDGTPITGEDFAFTHRVITDRRFPIRTDLREAYRMIVPGSLEAEEKTFAFTFRGGGLDYEFLFNVLLPAHQVEGSDFARDWNETPWMSGGPFRLAEWREGEWLRVERNERYWKTDPETGQQLPYLEAVTFRFFSDPFEMVEAFKAREIHVMNPPAAPEVVEELRLLESEGADLQMRTGPLWEHLNFQFGPGRLDRNPDSLVEYRAFRQAVAYLIDRSAIARRVTSDMVPSLDSFVPVYWPPASGDAWARYDRDPERARRLLAELGDQLGRDFEAEPPVLSFVTSTEPAYRVEVAEMLVPMLAEGGITLEVQLEEPAVFFNDIVIRRGTYEMAQWAWVARPGRSGLVDAMRTTFRELPPSGLNFSRWRPTGREPDLAARAAEILADLDSVVEEDQLVEEVREVERLLAEEAVIVPLWAEPNPGVVWADVVGGYRHNPTNAGDTWNVELWYRVEGS